jgi:hypothetical protein
MGDLVKSSASVWVARVVYWPMAIVSLIFEGIAYVGRIWWDGHLLVLEKLGIWDDAFAMFATIFELLFVCGIGIYAILWLTGA